MRKPFRARRMPRSGLRPARGILLPLALVFLAGSSSAQVQPTAASASWPKGSLVVAGYYDAKPSCFRDSEGRPAGIFVEVLNLVAARRGWTIDWEFRTWDGLLAGLRDRSIDLVPAIVRTEDRKSFASFTAESVMTDWGTLYALRGGSRISSILGLEGKKVGALEADYWFSGPGSLRDLCSGFGVKPDYAYYEDYSALFEALGKGEVEAAAASNSLGIVWEPRVPISATSVVYNPIDLRYASPKGLRGEALAHALDDSLGQLREEEPAALRDILGAWQVPIRKEYVAPPWLLWLLAVLSAVALVLLALTIIEVVALRRSVAAKSAALDRLRETSLALESSLAEKNVLVHELAHRVKNNLQIMISLMSLAEADGRPEAGTRSVLARLTDKLHALALAEEEISARSAIDGHSARRLVESIVARACASSGLPYSSFSVLVAIEGEGIEASSSAPLAIILAELASNACVHGRSADGSLRAALELRFHPDGSGEVILRDEGPGLAAEGAGKGSCTDLRLGLALVEALAIQMGGRLECGPGEGGIGAMFAIRFRHRETAEQEA